MSSVSGSFSSSFDLTYLLDSGILSGTRQRINKDWTLSLRAGNAAGQINRLHAATYTFVASTLQTLNLKSLVDPFGATFTDLARVRALGLRLNTTDDTATLTVGADGTANEWTGLLTVGSTIVIRSAGASQPAWHWYTAPGTVAYTVGSSSRLLKLLPSAHIFTVDVVVAGST